MGDQLSPLTIAKPVQRLRVADSSPRQQTGDSHATVLGDGEQKHRDALGPRKIGQPDEDLLNAHSPCRQLLLSCARPTRISFAFRKASSRCADRAGVANAFLARLTYGSDAAPPRLTTSALAPAASVRPTAAARSARWRRRVTIPRFGDMARERFARRADELGGPTQDARRTA
jgi:hypothetical protein